MRIVFLGVALLLCAGGACVAIIRAGEEQDNERH